MSDDVSFTKPQLCTYNGDISRPWFVFFDITDEIAGITVRKQYRGGINYTHDSNERLKAGINYLRYWENRLKSGWSPFAQAADRSLSKMNFNEAVDFALKNCSVAKKTKLDYTGAAEFFKAAAIKLNLSNARITAIKRQHVKLMIDLVKKERSWSNHAYNKNLGYLSGILSRLEEYEIIEHNPAKGIKRLQEAESSMYEPFTEEEKLVIRDHLLKIHPAFFTYVMLIYYCGIRPKEILALRISDLKLDRNVILIKPDIEEENSKTKSIRTVAVDNNLIPILRAHILDESPDLFVFGGVVGKFGSKTGARQRGYFMPSPQPIKRDTATKLWKSIVIDGLKIEKYMYALKHTGGNDKILAGVSLDALKEMYGHSSKFMTEKYAKVIKKIHAREIIDKSKEF